MIRVGVIGAGENTRKRHLPNLKAISGVQIVEVANRSLESSQKAAEAFDIPHVRGSWQEVAASPDNDAVLIGTWPYLHCPAACLALKSGKHVLCEARMAMDAEEARTMLDTAQRYPDRVAQLVPAPFTFGLDATIKDHIESRALGRLLYFQAEYQSASLASPTSALHWRRNKNFSGLNVMVLGIVYESLLRWLPPARWVTSHAHVFNDTAIDPVTAGRAEVEVPDYLSVQMQLENGMLGSMLISEAGQFGGTPKVRIFGERGTLELEFTPGGRLWFGTRESGEMQEVEIPKEKQGVWRVEEEFIGAIRGEEEIKLTTFETGVQYMQFTQAVHDSWQSGGNRVTV